MRLVNVSCVESTSDSKAIGNYLSESVGNDMVECWTDEDLDRGVYSV